VLWRHFVSLRKEFEVLVLELMGLKLWSSNEFGAFLSIARGEVYCFERPDMSRREYGEIE
jgi:hypothetical protein